MGYANPGQVILGCIRKGPDQALRNKPASLYQFLPQVPRGWTVCGSVCELDKPFPPQVTVAITAVESKPELPPLLFYFWARSGFDLTL